MVIYQGAMRKWIYTRDLIKLHTFMEYWTMHYKVLHDKEQQL